MNLIVIANYIFTLRRVKLIYTENCNCGGENGEFWYRAPPTPIYRAARQSHSTHTYHRLSAGTVAGSEQLASVT